MAETEADLEAELAFGARSDNYREHDEREGGGKTRGLGLPRLVHRE